MKKNRYLSLEPGNAKVGSKKKQGKGVNITIIVLRKRGGKKCTFSRVKFGKSWSTESISGGKEKQEDLSGIGSYSLKPKCTKQKPKIVEKLKVLQSDMAGHRWGGQGEYLRERYIAYFLRM